MDIELVTDPDACMTYIVSPLAGLGGAYCGGLPHTGCYVYIVIAFAFREINIIILLLTSDNDEKLLTGVILCYRKGALIFSDGWIERNRRIKVSVERLRIKLNDWQRILLIIDVEASPRIDKSHRHQQQQKQRPMTSFMTSLNRRRPENMKCRRKTAFEVAAARGAVPRRINAREEIGLQLFVVRINYSRQSNDRPRPWRSTVQ